MAAILLDLDGTLTDPGIGVERCLRHALSTLGCEPPHIALARAVGPPLREVLGEWMAGAAEASVDEAIRLYRERYSEQGLYENAVYPGVVELLDGIRARGWRSYVVTSKLEVIAVRVLAHFGLAAYLAGVCGSRSGELGRKQDLVARVLRRESIPSDAAVVVGDRQHDVRGARACGLDAIGVTHGYGTREELERAGAAWICDSPPSVLRVLDRLLGTT
jgi:phosphoglycolate phosphatase